jgi:hypothetical protein
MIQGPRCRREQIGPQLDYLASWSSGVAVVGRGSLDVALNQADLCAASPSPTTRVIKDLESRASVSSGFRTQTP